jgi:hypothetical protein
MELIKRQCINLLVDEAINADSKDIILAYLLIFGLTSGLLLAQRSIDDLLEDVYTQCQHLFSSEESDLFVDDNDAFKKWIMARNPTADWCELTK